MKKKTKNKKKKLGASLTKVNMLEERMAPLVRAEEGGIAKPPGG